MKHITCRKCAGKKIIPNFKHVDEGICFTCYGSGFEEVEDDVTDVIKEMRNKRKLNKEAEKIFDSLFNQHEEKMSNSWKQYIMAINNYSARFKRLQRYLQYNEELKIGFKEIDINSETFFEEYEKLKNQLDNKFMIEGDM